MTTKITSYIVKVFSLFIILAVLLLPLTVAFAQGSEGIVLVKDVFLAVQDVEDLPDEVTFALYDSETAATPIATQTFQKGEYAVDYDFSKLDGFTFGSVARFEVNFTNTLNINDDSDTSVKIYEIWTEMEIDGTVAGNREPVSNETLVQLLLASDASISTYLTLVYEGDENPITSIYKDLPISSLGADGSEFSLGSYFSAVAAGTSGEEIIGPVQVAGSDGQIQYNNSDVQAGASQFYYDDTNDRVGIGTANPLAKLQVEGNFSLGTTPKVGLSRWTNGTDALCRYGANMPNLLGEGRPDRQGGFLSFDTRTNQTVIAFWTKQPGSSVETERMGITNTGNVGIGTANPLAKLQVEGNFSLGTTPKVGLSRWTNGTDALCRYGANMPNLLGEGRPDRQGGFLSFDTRTNQTVIAFWTKQPGSSVETERMGITNTGNVGIGTTNPTYKLAVNGTIRAKEIIVDTGWSDFVFDKNYRLPPLGEVEQFIISNKHLPGIPTEAEVRENGVTLGGISSKLLQKIEELTLYVIDLKKENDSLKAQLGAIQAQLSNGRR